MNMTHDNANIITLQSLFFNYLIREPIQGFLDSRPLECRAHLQSPGMVFDLMQTVLAVYLLFSHGVLEIGLVG